MIYKRHDIVIISYEQHNNFMQTYSEENSRTFAIQGSSGKPDIFTPKEVSIPMSFKAPSENNVSLIFTKACTTNI